MIIYEDFYNVLYWFVCAGEKDLNANSNVLIMLAANVFKC